MKHQYVFKPAKEMYVKTVLISITTIIYKSRDVGWEISPAKRCKDQLKQKLDKNEKQL